MKSMKLFLIAAFVILSVISRAQHRIIFSSRDYLGLLEGQHGSAFQLQTINGAKYKTWFAGLGTGLDWYYLRTIPLFFTLNKDFLKQGNRNFFMAIDGGVNFLWQDDRSSAESGFSKIISYPGFYYEAGLGYRIGIGKKNDALLMQFGYNYKHIREKVRSAYPIVYLYPYETISSSDHIDYHLRKLSLKIGWNF
jgi:hypothetical protein